MDVSGFGCFVVGVRYGVVAFVVVSIGGGVVVMGWNGVGVYCGIGFCGDNRVV